VSLDLTELQWERLAIRMVHKVCPVKDRHAGLAADEVCDQCGIRADDHRRFIAGDEGKRERRAAGGER
jgi:hypothetical protein